MRTGLTEKTHRVHPHRASLELSSNPGCFFQIIRPYRGPKTHLGVVGSRNDIRLVGPGHERNNGSEGLFGGDF
jgi:hypothetical protein